MIRKVRGSYPFHYFKCTTCNGTWGQKESEKPKQCILKACQPKKEVFIHTRDTVGRNAQLNTQERPVLWTKKMEDGHTEVRHPGRNDGDMPDYYKKEGYVRTEFNTYQEHKKFCDDNGLVNHKIEGIRDEALEG